MIQLNRSYKMRQKEDDTIPIKIIGVGGAGSNALDRVVLDGMDKSDLIAANTDVQSLASAVAAIKVQLGRSLTRGLGTGGDPEVGFSAGQESADEIRAALKDTRLVFLCMGLGGGTGSGAGPLIAQIAREMGALVITFATLPFSFEGKRRNAQAQEALARLHTITDAVVCFENDRLGDMVAPKAGIHQAFAVADMTISQSVRAIVNLIQRPGLIRIGFDDLLAALRGGGGRCLFGYGESDSDNRAHAALAHALKNPLMDRGRMLAEASHVLVQVTGGPAMTLSEVEILMRELNKHISDHTHLLFGTAVDSRMGNRLSVTLISSLACESKRELFVPPAPKEPEFIAAPMPEPEIVSAVEAAPGIAPLSPLIESAVDPIIEPTAVTEETVIEEPISEQPAFNTPPAPVEIPEPVVDEIAPEPAEEIEPAAPRIIPPRKKPMTTAKPEFFPAPAPKPAKEKIVHAKQEVLQFEPVTRGRFEKSEPTIVEGQDLDVPTYLRRNVRVK